MSPHWNRRRWLSNVSKSLRSGRLGPSFWMLLTLLMLCVAAAAAFCFILGLTSSGKLLRCLYSTRKSTYFSFDRSCTGLLASSEAQNLSKKILLVSFKSIISFLGRTPPLTLIPMQYASAQGNSSFWSLKLIGYGLNSRHWPSFSESSISSCLTKRLTLFSEKPCHFL